MKRPLFLHPFLLAIYPVLALLSHNLDQIPLAEAIRPLALSLLLALVLFGLGFAFLRNALRAALLASLFLVLIFSYGHVYGLAEGMRLGGALIGRHRFLAPLWGGLLLVGTLAVLRWGRRAYSLNTALNAVAVVLCLFPAMSMLSFARHASDDMLPVSTPVAPVETTSASLPSVYYIILDGYARQDILSEVFSFDNQPFLEGLQARGFQIAERSRSNYPNTALSLASSLNMDYLETLAGPFDPQSRDLAPLFNLIQHNRVQQAFHEMGYATVAFASGYRGTELRTADRYLAPEVESTRAQSLFGDLTPFEGMLVQTSAGLLLTESNAALPPRFRLDLEAPYLAHRRRIEFALEHIPQVDRTQGPEFVFAHLVVPHPPFVFGPHGEELQHTAAFSLSDASYRGDYQGYLQAYTDQVIFLNGRLETMLDELLASSPTPPIILLQSDHGSGASGLSSAHGSVPYLEERFSNFIAVYAPACPGLRLDSTATPVNLFRLILRDCYGLPYELLSNRSYFSNYVRPYALREITPELSR